MSSITCKFGGSSLADAECIRRVKEIIESDSERRFIVVSAPGKRTRDDKKITDLLYAWHGLAKQGLDASQPADMVAQRFIELAEALEVQFDVRGHLAEISEAVVGQREADFMASRGEYLNGRLVSELLGATFIEPAECIKFDEEGALDPTTYDLLAERLAGEGLFVIPGFYGALPDGRVKTFSRGGSDVTGAIVARASSSSLYENWTDVNGIRVTDPELVPEAKRIEEITYAELRELSYMGAKVMHDEAIFPVRAPGIPIHIRNTREPEQPGTMIVSKRDATHPVCGIAGKTGFTMITIEKTLMNHEIGFGRRLLTILEEHGVNFEHMPTGIDTISLIIADEEMAHHGAAIVRNIERRCDPDRVTLTPGLALVATVGQGMIHHVGVASRLCGALANAGVNIRVIDQGSSEMNIIVGIEEKDLGAAVRGIYDAFLDWG